MSTKKRTQRAPRRRQGQSNWEARVRIGVDLVQIGRLARLVEKFPKFAERTFSKRELGVAGGLTARRREEYLAGRFAVKEATLKALGVGLTRNLRLTDIETLSKSSGAPRLILLGNVSEFATRIGIGQVRVSISHERGVAIAFVVMASGEPLARPDEEHLA